MATTDPTTPTEPTPTPETTLHPDDGTSLTSISILCTSCDPPHKMARIDKEVLSTGVSPHTRYTYACAGSTIHVEVPHLSKT